MFPTSWANNNIDCVSSPVHSFTFNSVISPPPARYKSRAITRYILTDPACLITLCYMCNHYFQSENIIFAKKTRSIERIM